MKRVQRKRAKGWKMPKNTKYVGRPTKWGNPLKIEGDQIYINASYRRKILDPWVWYNLGDIDDIIYLYRKLWDGTKFQNSDLQFWADEFKKLDLNELRGMDLACFCPLTSPCHADVLIELCQQPEHWQNEQSKKVFCKCEMPGIPSRLNLCSKCELPIIVKTD